MAKDKDGNEIDDAPKGHEGINELVASVRQLLGKDASNVNDALIKDNFQLRDQKRQLKADLDSARKAVPADGSVVLTGDDAKAWEGYKAFGMKPEEIGAVLTDYDDLSTRVTSREAGEALGWDPKVLAGIMTDKGLSIEMSEVEVVSKDKDGKETKEKRSMPFTQTADGKKVQLNEFEDLKPYHKSLIMDEGEDGGAGGRTTTTGVRMPASRSTSSSSSKSEPVAAVTGNYLGSRYTRPSQRGKAADTKK